MKVDIDIMDINPIVNVVTAKAPMYVLDATWMTGCHLDDCPV